MMERRQQYLHRPWESGYRTIDDLSPLDHALVTEVQKMRWGLSSDVQQSRTKVVKLILKPNDQLPREFEGQAPISVSSDDSTLTLWYLTTELERIR
jgi:lipid II:glycine glycyltransferase (peptidoglycan interpeptide bridge formation enzyme)